MVSSVHVRGRINLEVSAKERRIETSVCTSLSERVNLVVEFKDRPRFQTTRRNTIVGYNPGLTLRSK